MGSGRGPAVVAPDSSNGAVWFGIQCDWGDCSKSACRFISRLASCTSILANYCFDFC